MRDDEGRECLTDQRVAMWSQMTVIVEEALAGVCAQHREKIDEGKPETARQLTDTTLGPIVVEAALDLDTDGEGGHQHREASLAPDANHALEPLLDDRPRAVVPGNSPVRLGQRDEAVERRAVVHPAPLAEFLNPAK